MKKPTKPTINKVKHDTVCALPKQPIEKLSVTFTREDMNELAAKINEIIDAQ